MVREKEIPACFDDSPGDQGERILTSYINGDKVVAYAKGYGAVGWGVVENSNSYKLLNEGDNGDKLNGCCLHRLKVSWKATAKKLSEGMKPDLIRDTLEIYHPLSTSVPIDKKRGEKLINKLSEKFKGS